MTKNSQSYLNGLAKFLSGPAGMTAGSRGLNPLQAIFLSAAAVTEVVHLAGAMRESISAAMHGACPVGAGPQSQSHTTVESPAGVPAVPWGRRRNSQVKEEGWGW